MIRAVVLVTIGCPVWAQTPAEPAPPAPLEFKGAPLRLPFVCTAEDSQQNGLTCSRDEACPVYLELSASESILNKVFLAGNLHTANATLYSVLLASEDGGKTWSEPAERIPFGALEQIQFLDFQTGWVGGAILAGVPHDPFFLLTSDGGKTWQRKPIFEDGRPGVVERFRFDSKLSGTMIIATPGRHELFVTGNGAEGWTLRQAAQAEIRMPRERQAPDDDIVRLRPDSKIKGYRVERQRDSNWTLIASFLVDAGQCEQ